jgi:hypothetical protein
VKKSAIGVSGVVLVFSLVAFAGNEKVTKVEPRVTVVRGISASACDAVVGNLVVNCGFETGDFTNWIQSGDLAFTGVTGLARYTGAFGDQTGPIGDLGYITQILPTTAGQTYSLFFALRNANFPNEFQVIWDGVVIVDNVDMPDFDYTVVEIDGLVASGDGTELDFGFRNDPDYIYIDDIVVVPAT